MIMERRAIEQRFRNELRENMKDAAYEPETFGDPDATEKISDSIFRRGVVSIALWSGDYSAICINLSILLQNLIHSLAVNDLNHNLVQIRCWYMHALE
jgi:hypothetical protein